MDHPTCKNTQHDVASQNYRDWQLFKSHSSFLLVPCILDGVKKVNILSVTYLNQKPRNHRGFFLLTHFDFHIDAARKIEVHERVNGFWCWVDDID